MDGTRNSGRQEIPDIVIRRLPIYVRALRHLFRDGINSVSSNTLAGHIGVTAAQIRRDLSYFGRFGKQGKGYDVPMLIDAIEEILNLDQRWDVALAGYGHLGQAIASYRGFELSAFRITAIFDRDERKIGEKSPYGVEVQAESQMVDSVRKLGIAMGIVAVPASEAQRVADEMIQGGIRAILNYAPVTLRTPANVRVREIDPISLMQSMTYYLGNGREDWSEDRAELDVAGS